MSRLPFEISVAQPCTQQWSEMTGSNVRRHCQSCNKQVHNIAAMTPRQVERLIDETGGRFCARISHDSDGSFVTLPTVENRHVAHFVLAAALSVGTSLVAQSTSDHKTGAVTGIIKNPFGVPIEGAKVEVVQPGEAAISTITNKDGVYKLEAPRGAHTLEASSPGFGSYMFPAKLTRHIQSIPPITLRVGEVLTGDIVVVDNRPWYRKIGTRTRRLLHISS
jgi:hypothetical protein